MTLADLHDAIAKIAPIDSVAIAPDQIDFKAEATDEQQAKAWEIFNGWEDPAEPQWKTFGEAIAIEPTYLRNTTHNTITLGLKSTFELMLKISADGDLRLESIRDLWNAIAAQSNPTSEEIEMINGIIEVNAIDQFFTLQADGIMILT
ncbi:MAG: hypothetical protein J7647_26130 [Cyanobacteria bacterium SBLK]|nr:hypothetical protein [Cyanobacteria bacterium SBLK]